MPADGYPFTEPAELPEADRAGDCPDCLDGIMSFKQSDHVEPHGEPVHESWYECGACGYQEAAPR